MVFPPRALGQYSRLFLVPIVGVVVLTIAPETIAVQQCSSVQAMTVAIVRGGWPVLVGQAVPFIIGRHVHPQVPQAQLSTPRPPTRVDYLGLVVAEHDRQVLGQIAYRDLPRAAQEAQS